MVPGGILTRVRGEVWVEADSEWETGEARLSGFPGEEATRLYMREGPGGLTPAESCLSGLYLSLLGSGSSGCVPS